jgi:lipoyl(octanoyl) transferase
MLNQNWRTGGVLYLKMMNRVRCAVESLGLVEYETAWRLQAEYAAEIAAGARPPTLLLLEHPHTYTFGRLGKIENLIWNQEELDRREIKIQWVDRGGDVTYHGPGQLVGYPLLPLATGGMAAGHSEGELRLPKADYVGYVRKLEETLILTLADLGVEGFQIKGLTGVWVRLKNKSSGSLSASRTGEAPAKIAAIGVKVDAKGISRHGFAFNIAPDMDYWKGIIGCGLREHSSTCLADLVSPTPSIEEAAACIVTNFGHIFGYEMMQRRK